MPEKYKIDFCYIDQRNQGEYTLSGFRLQELVELEWLEVGIFHSHQSAVKAMRARNGTTVLVFDENGIPIDSQPEPAKPLPEIYPPKEATIIGTVFTKNVGGGPPDD